MRPGRFDRTVGVGLPDRAGRRAILELHARGKPLADGTTFGGRVAVSDRPFDAGIGFGSERGLPDLGSRLSVLSDAARAMVVWTDTRAGTVASGKQDLGVAVVRFHRSAGLRLPLGVLGVVAVLAGAAAVWGTARRA